jgi:hypothetical protein
LAACGDDGEDADEQRRRLTCWEYAPGEAIDPSIGGSEASRTTLQAALDYATVASAAVIELTAIWTSIAFEDGVAVEAIDAALARAAYANDASAICGLARDAIEQDPSIEIAAPPPICTVPAALVAACETHCVPASADSTSAWSSCCALG